MQLQQEKQIAKSNLLRKCGLLAHTSPAFLKNCCTEKLFVCLRLGSYNQYKDPTHPHHSSADESGSSFYQSEIRSKCLAHNHFNSVNAAVKYRQNISFNLLTINGNRLNTLADVLRVLYSDFVSVATELSGNSETIPSCGMDGSTFRPFQSGIIPRMY